MPTRIPQVDWEDYDNKKIRDGRDRSKFSCDEPWEVDYLVKVLKKSYPYNSENSIRQAIQDCCKSVDAPRPRQLFVDCVEKRL